eukprot:c2562_g1_i1 orf=87-758(+)
MEPQPASTFIEQLELAKKKHELCLAKVSASIEETRSLCQFINTDGRENIEALKERLKDLHLEKRACDDKQVQRSTLHESVILLKSRTQDLENGIAELSDVRQHQDQLISSELAEIERGLEEKRRKNDLMLEGLHWYERNLGFRVKPTKNNGLWIILTKVVPTDLDREFSFSIRHDKQRNVYTLLECNPDVASSKDLVNELNRTNDFKMFIINMRKMFQAEFCR